jgi:hypothetical protein
LDLEIRKALTVTVSSSQKKRDIQLQKAVLLGIVVGSQLISKANATHVEVVVVDNLEDPEFLSWGMIQKLFALWLRLCLSREVDAFPSPPRIPLR